MLFNFLKSPERPDKVYRVKILKPVVAGPWDGRAETRSVGDELDVTAEVRAQLIGSGDAITLGLVDRSGKLVPIAKASPADRPFTPEAVPEKWKDLPPCFATAWKHAEELRELKHNVTVARAAVDAVKVTDLDSPNEEHRAANARLHAAYTARHEYDPEKAQRAQIACGVATAEALAESNLVRDRLEQVAFEIFSERIAALGLAQSKIRSLFAGSALHQKYVVQPLHLGRMRLAAKDAFYSDAPLPTLADFLFRARNCRKEWLVLLKEAEAELEAAQSVREASGPRQLAKRKVA